MKHLAALLSLILLAPGAIAQDDPDVEVYLPVATPSNVPYGVHTFDSDWTANGLLAMAFVEDYAPPNSLLATPRRLVVATFDPMPQSGQPAFVRVAEFFTTSSWTMTELSLAVPPAWFGDEDMDRIFVAATVEAPTVNAAGKVVRGVRLFSVPIGSQQAKMTMLSPGNVPEMSVNDTAEPPHPQVSLLPYKGSYVVDLAFIDPNNELWNGQGTHGGQVMLARSFDHGASLGKAFYATGHCAQNCCELQATMGASVSGSMGISQGTASCPKFELPALGKLSVAADENGGHTLIAVEDLDNNVIHVLYGKPDEQQVHWLDRTPGGLLSDFSPRIASVEGMFNLTCLRGSKFTKNGHQLTWFFGRLDEQLTQLQPLHPRAATEGDIEVRDGKAFIVARCFPDGGGKPVPMVFEDQRNDPFRNPTAVEIADDGISDGDPRAAITPPGIPKLESYLFQRPRDGAAPEGVRLDP